MNNKYGATFHALETEYEVRIPHTYSIYDVWAIVEQFNECPETRRISYRHYHDICWSFTFFASTQYSRSLIEEMAMDVIDFVLSGGRIED